MLTLSTPAPRVHGECPLGAGTAMLWAWLAAHLPGQGSAR